jgi:hypothetical protein
LILYPIRRGEKREKRKEKRREERRVREKKEGKEGRRSGRGPIGRNDRGRSFLRGGERCVHSSGGA